MKRLLTSLLALLLVQPAFSQQEADDGTQSGYTEVTEFGGPDGVSSALKRDDEKRGSTYQFDGLQRGLKPYFDWKRRIQDEHGVALGAQFYVLFQDASSSLGGRDSDAFGNIFRFFGKWTVFSRDNGNLGRVEWRVESRSNFGNFQAPGSLGSRLAFDVYLDAFPFQTFSRGFLNRSFVLNPTLPTTGVGAIGGVVKGFVTDNIWLGAQMHDANAASGDFDWDTLQEGEWLKAIEVGYTPSFDARNDKRVQLTLWEKDERTLAGVSKGRGWAVSAAYKLNDKYFPFVRFGHSDGGAGVAAESSVSAGVEIMQAFDQVWTIGAGWARPSSETYGSGLSNETVLETSYKFQLSQNFSLMPDVQVVFNPAYDTSESSVWVFSLRAILSL
jgi:porin